MAEQDRKITEIKELGEFQLIEALTKDIPLYHKSTIKGIGDDAAVIDAGDRALVMTTDMLMEGIHFSLIYTPMKHLGYKAAIVNFSDVYAMNAEPKQMVVSLAVSGKFTYDALKEFYSGLKLACETYKVDLVGGDTSSSITGMAISITVIGETAKNKVSYRNGAKVNDLICVTGDLGAAYLGLQVLEREKKLFEQNKGFQPKLDGYDYVLKRQLKPEARKDIIEFLDEQKLIPTSMIDISDGLSSEILHICSQSDTGCKIFQNKIPVEERAEAVAEELNLEPLVCALNGGEDYELLFTAPLDSYEKLMKNRDISIIGHITDKSEGRYMITDADTAVELRAQGWSAYQA
ncbi:MAG TPA: thiamine-phosphate kinase [Bacteroidales bacterium]|nr:thiamine-phosphate kinase [Bacteroidales bacterium]